MTRKAPIGYLGGLLLVALLVLLEALRPTAPPPPPRPGWRTLRPPETVFACQLEGDCLWLGCADGLYQVDVNSFRVVRRPTPIPLEYIRALALDSRGGLYIGHSRGLSYLRSDRWRHWGPAEGLSDERVTALALDGIGQLWIGTQAGLARLPAGNGGRGPSAAGLGRGEPTGSAASAPQVAGEVSVENRTGEVSGRELAGKIPVRDRTGEVSGQDLAGELPVQAAGVVSGPAGEGRLRPAGMTGLQISALAATPQGLWVGTAAAPRGGLTLLVDGRPQATLTVDDGLPHNSINALAGQGDELWVGTGFLDQGGLARVARRDGRWQVVQRLGPDQGLAGAKVRSLMLDAWGVLWVGSEYDGLCRLTPAGPVRWTVADGLADPEVMCQVQQSDGTVWLGTRNGLNRVGREVLRTEGK